MDYFEETTSTAKIPKSNLLTNDPVDFLTTIAENIVKERAAVSPILAAICLTAQPGAADEKLIDSRS